MRGQMKKLALTPAKFNKDGGIDKFEFATVTLEIPLEDPMTQKEVIALFDVLHEEFIDFELVPAQVPIDLEGEN